jgi:hypothetical protein
VVFESWDLEVMAAAIANGGVVPLNDVGTALALAFPELDAHALVAAIVADIQAAAQASEPATRFWGEFLIELGRQATEPYDLLAPSLDFSTVHLDPVQVGLVVQPLAAAIWVFADTSTLAGARRARSTPAAAQTRQARPCTLTETEQTILDAAAAASGLGYSQLLDYLADKGLSGAEKYAKATAWANAILTYGKLIWTLLVFKTEFHMTPAELVRTHSGLVNGEQSTVTVEVRLELGDAQIVNCFRIAFNAAGLDFDLWNTGAVANAGVDWDFLEGREYLRFALGNVPLKRRTNAQGQDTIIIEGLHQDRTLPPDAERVDKRGRLQASVSLKTANLVQDLLDATSGAASLPAEMAFRGFGLFKRAITFTVVDWHDPCNFGTTRHAGRSVAARAAVCTDTWTGSTSTSTPLGSLTTSAQVTWKIAPELSVGDKITYYAEGMVTLSQPPCSISPPSHPITKENGGFLEVDYSVDPPTYFGAGATTWFFTSHCPESGQSISLTSGATWFVGRGTVSPDGTTIAGTESDSVTTYTYTFTRQ